MDKDINLQKLNYLTCPTHNKRIQFFCTAEQCNKTMICSDCMVNDKDHVAIHLDAFSSTEDYKNKVITSMFQKFEECQLKVENQILIINNNVNEISSVFDKEFNGLHEKTIALVNEFFANLKNKMAGLIGLKFENYLSSLKDLLNELLETRSNSQIFLESLKKFLDSDFQNSKIEEQIRFFNRKKFFDRSLIGRVETLLNFISENSKLSDNKQITKLNFRIDEAKLTKTTNEITKILKGAFDKYFEESEIVKDMVSKPAFTINRLSQNYFTISDPKKFIELDHFDKLNSFEMSPHPNSKIKCLTVMDNKYVITAFNDRSYRIWFIIPQKFNMGMKTLIKGDLPFQAIFESQQGLHNGFVSALEYIKTNANAYRIFSGDYNGFVGIVDYEIREGKVSQSKTVSSFQANEFRIVNISYMAISDSMAIGDAKSTIGFWKLDNLTLIDVVKTKEAMDMVNFVFANNFGFVCLMSESGELYSWKPKVANSVDIAKSKLQALYEAQSVELKGFENHLKISFESDGFQKKTFNVFSTNYRGDFMVFVSDGFCLKVISIFNGDTITQVEGAHYKGISSLYFLVNNSTESQIYRILNIIENEHLHKPDASSPNTEKNIKKYYSDLLNCFKIITISNKEFIRIWMFKDLEAKLLDQDSHPGGSYGKCVFQVQNNKNENYLITSGKNSNRLLVYSLN